MLESSMKLINDKINNASISETEKRELLQQVEEIKTQLDGLSETDTHSAASIAGYTAIKTHERLSDENNSESEKKAEEGLNFYLQKFKVSHPTLVNTVDLLSRTLSRLGV